MNTELQVKRQSMAREDFSRTAGRPRPRAIAVACALAASLWCAQAAALTLGRTQVHSAMGEPLNAQIEITRVSDEELSSLTASLASVEAFASAGLNYDPALQGATIVLERASNGTYVLRIKGEQPVTHSFIDLVVVANWANGRLVRDLTLLVNPADGLLPSKEHLGASIGSGDSKRHRAQPAVSVAPAAAVQPSDQDGVTVKQGDTAGSIARRYLPNAISLDQMLVALLQSNPQAFTKGNINRLRAGAVLDIPSQQEAQAVAATEARQIVVAHSRDFNEFRRTLAQQPLQVAADGAPADRSASGKVESQVVEKVPELPSLDKLKLSKGAIQSKAGASAQAAAQEEAIARQREKKDAEDRLLELNRNIAELSKLTQKSEIAGVAAAPASNPSNGAPGLPAINVPVGTAALPTAPLVTASAASAPSKAPGKPALKAAAKPAPVAAEDSWVTSAWPIVAGGALAALLGGLWWGGRRLAARRRSGADLGGSLAAEAFDTKNEGSQSIPVAQDVDADAQPSGAPIPESTASVLLDEATVANESEVLLAHDRSQEAEAVLRPFLRAHPESIEPMVKLFEVFVARADLNGMTRVAARIKHLTAAQGSQWSNVAAIGKEIDPSNDLYNNPTTDAQFTDSTSAAATHLSAQPEAASSAADLVVDPFAHTPAATMEIDLNFSLDLGDRKS